ncbi:MAG TPA: hypothetical protein VNH18_03000 [Bryobacteraceae bacterium]|nr:hypothetical protein [Bryobacteraceae bacterium]HXJ38217.1 hypothetical protein [Bryobacteraceae bacterium]
MSARNRLTLLLLVALRLPVCAQEAGAGFSMPVTLTAGALYTHRLQTSDPAASPIAAAFHAVLYPSVKLGPHWFVYSSIHVRSTPFSYYDAYESEHELKTQVVQAFLGYTRAVKKATVLVKAGQLTSAFGSFPLHYDDADNALLDQPFSYVTYLNLRPDQLPCNADDIIYGSQYATAVTYHCGGSSAARDGLTPVTLYGLPGIELDLSMRKFDARFQVTNSSPANPQNLLSGSQHAQWTAGAGYTVAQGFRVGFSTFRGPFLNRDVAPLLPAGHNVRDFPATGAGLDAQWARGRWSTSGEWQWFHYNYPGFRSSPTPSFAYAEVKAVLNPRTYLAVRAGWQRNNHLTDLVERTEETFAPNRQSYEFAAGFRPNRWQLIKAGYEWLRTADVSGTRDNVFGIQLVTSLQPLSKAWH